MKQATKDRLDALNRAFYAQRAADLSATREGPWPGTARVLAALRSEAQAP